MPFKWFPQEIGGLSCPPCVLTLGPNIEYMAPLGKDTGLQSWVGRQLEFPFLVVLLILHNPMAVFIMFTDSRAAWKKAAWNVTWARPLWSMTKSSRCLHSGPEDCPRCLSLSLVLQGLTADPACNMARTVMRPSPRKLALSLEPGPHHQLELKQNSQSAREMEGADGVHRAQVLLLPYTPHSSRGDVKSEVCSEYLLSLRELKQDGNPQGIIIHKDLGRQGKKPFPSLFIWRWLFSPINSLASSGVKQILREELTF